MDAKLDVQCTLLVLALMETELDAQCALSILALKEDRTERAVRAVGFGVVWRRRVGDEAGVRDRLRARLGGMRTEERPKAPSQVGGSRVRTESPVCLRYWKLRQSRGG